MNKVIKRLLWVIVCAALVVGAVRLYDFLTDDFRLGNITHSIPYQAEWAIPKLTVAQELELELILSQNFHYIGKGSQSYAFVSEDGEYVLKFFKFKHLRPNIFFETLSRFGIFKQQHAKQTARKERKLWGVFRSYKLAYDLDRSETGLIFIQLNTEDNLKREVSLLDKMGFHRIVNLQNYTFILQKKGVPLEIVLDRYLKQGDLRSALMRIEKILELYASEYKKGIYDRDHAVMRNFGFIADQPIHMDVGKLVADEAMRDNFRARADALLVEHKIRHWIKHHYPQYEVELSAMMDQKIQQLYQ